MRIWIVDRKSLRTQDYVPLGPYGAVNEVRLIDVPDFAHHGTPLAGGREAIGARVAEGTRSTRLRASHTAQESAPYWRRFVPVLGSPVADEDGWRTSTNELFIAVLRKSEPGLGCEYRLTAERGAHVSLIAGYRGNGHDTHMDAFLLQREGQTAALSLWRHEGAGWRQEPAMRVGNLPLAGEMRIETSQESASIFSMKTPSSRTLRCMLIWMIADGSVFGASAHPSARAHDTGRRRNGAIRLIASSSRWPIQNSNRHNRLSNQSRPPNHGRDAVQIDRSRCSDRCIET